jgi:hypothetical protein
MNSRAFGFALGLAAATVGVGGSHALAQPAFSSVSVDASPLATLGIGASAAQIKGFLEADLRELFAAQPGAGKSGTRLVVRVTGLTLSSNTPGNGSNGLGRGEVLVPQESDYIEGEGLVISSNGAIISRTPILARLDSTYAGPWYAPDINVRRVKALSYQFAWWLRRQLPQG